jgi:LCP family protein required for cell wall assembly
VFSGAVVVVLLTAAGSLTYVYSKYSRLPRVELGSVLTETSSSNEPRNFLLVGVDSAANLDPDDPARAGRGNVGGLRSDTIMVLRLDPGAERASLLSLPRDLWVPLAGGGTQRINSAIQDGGPSELIDTIEGYFGIPINHYIQVDFAGFQELVDVVDGVQVYFADPARDSRSGLDIQDTGCLTSTASRRCPTCGRGTSRCTRTVAGAATARPTWGASAASRTSSSGRWAAPSTRGCATPSPSTGS